MDAILAFRDDLVNLVDSHLRGVVDFHRAPRSKPAVEDTEHDRLKYGMVVIVKGTIDEHVVRIAV